MATLVRRTRVRTAPPSTEALWSVLYGAAPPDVMLTITERVLLDIDATVHGLEISGNGSLRFAPNSSQVLQVDQQRPVCVMDGGHLEMIPASPTVTHEIRFINVDESLFTSGGGMNHTANPGLCVEDATVTLQGAARTGWTRTTGALLAGATTCTVVDAGGWRVGDEIVITPTEAATVSNHFHHFDRRTLTNVAGNVLTFAATTYPHPSNTTPLGTVIYPEVANLTRNVLIGGQDTTHRAQIMFMGTCTGSILEYFEGKYLGPQQGGALVVGRYGLHFHLMAEGSRNISVRGVSLHEIGSRAFVPHGSHGMTFTDCVAWTVDRNAYWWDSLGGAGPSANETNDLLYDHCFAGRVVNEDSFQLDAGTNMVMRNCVATAMITAGTDAGYQWPEILNDNERNVWTFEDNDSHNNAGQGIYIWQNDYTAHTLTRFRGWNNGHLAGIAGDGIDAGAYLNLYHYVDCQMWGNRYCDMEIHASTAPNDVGRQILISGGAIDLVYLSHHEILSANRTLFLNVTIGRVQMVETNSSTAANHDFVNCGITDADLTISPYMVPGSVVRIQNGASAWQITTADGTTKITTPIATFYP